MECWLGCLRFGMNKDCFLFVGRTGVVGIIVFAGLAAEDVGCVRVGPVLAVDGLHDPGLPRCGEQRRHQQECGKERKLK